jgi:hypothetical protein
VFDPGGTIQTTQLLHCPLSVLTVNCGSGGLITVVSRIISFLMGLGREVDVLVLTETHLCPGDRVDVPGYDVVWATRANSRVLSGCGRRIRPKGGVAFAVCTRSPFSMSSIVRVCDRGDAALLRLESDEFVAHVCGVYLPPKGPTCCNCLSAGCTKAHVDAVLGAVSEWCDSVAADGPLIVSGDFNADLNSQLPAVVHRQRSIIECLQQRLTQCQLLLANPRCSTGFVPTRVDAVSGSATVLDLVFTSRFRGVTVVVESNLVSDHYLLLTTGTVAVSSVEPVVVPPSVGRNPRLEFPRLFDRWGLVLPLPEGVVTNVALSVSQSTSNLSVQSLSPSQLVSQLSVSIVDSISVCLTQSRPPLVSPRCLIGVATIPVTARDVSTAPPLPLPSASFHSAHRVVERLLRRTRGLLSKQQPIPPELQRALDAAIEERRLQRQLQRMHSRQWTVATRSALYQSIVGSWIRGHTVALLRQLSTFARGQSSTTCRQRQLKQRAGASGRIKQRLQRFQAFLKTKYTAPPQPSGVRQHNADKYQCQRTATRLAIWTSKQQANFSGRVVLTRQQVANAVAALKPSSAALGLSPAVWKSIAVPPVVDSLLVLFQGVFDSGIVPAEWCCVKAHPIVKGNSPAAADDLANYRFIGISSALSRVFQNVLLALLQSVITLPSLGQQQFGFVSNCSAQMAALLARGVVETESSRSDSMVYTCFLDIKGAYPSCNHAMVLSRLRKLGVAGDLWCVLDSWLSQQTMFVQIGQHVSELFPVTVGLSEGCTFSPFVYNCVGEVFITKLESIGRQFPEASVKLITGASVSSIWFADDGFLVAKTPTGLQQLLQACSDVSDAVLLSFNVAPTKTAVLIHFSGRVREAMAPSLPNFHLGPNSVPRVSQYKHLGLQWCDLGPKGSTNLHQATVMELKVSAVLGKCSSSGVKRLPLLQALILYKTWWLPSVVFGWSVVCAKPPPSVLRMEKLVMRMMLGTNSVPVVAMRSVLGLPTLQTVLNLDTFRLLIQCLSLPPKSTCRQLLFSLMMAWRQCNDTQRTGCWWSRIASALSQLDAVCVVRLPVQGGQLPEELLWSQALHWLVTDWQQRTAVFPTLLQAVKSQFRTALLTLDNVDFQHQFSQCSLSLGEVSELITTSCNFHPFILQPRDKACEWRIKLRGGRLATFGHWHFHRNHCPACQKPDGFRIGHLLRDCGSFEVLRAKVWSASLEFCVSKQLMTPHNPCEQRHLWYLLSAGASVPSSFFAAGLDTPTHFARCETPQSRWATQGLRQHAAEYVTVLKLTGELVCEVFETVERLLLAGVPDGPLTTSV